MADPESEPRDTVLKCRQVTKRFGGLLAVDSISFAVRRGEFFSLLGPSGCGKTTTLRLIAGFEGPQGATRGRGPLRRRGAGLRDRSGVT